MRVVIGICVLLIFSAVHGAQPEYFSSRKWVEQECGTDTRPKGKCTYVGRVVPRKYAAVFHFYKQMTLRDVIDQTPFKGTAVMVQVLRAESRTSSYVFRVGPSEKPKYRVKSQDMIWLYEDDIVVIK